MKSHCHWYPDEILLVVNLDLLVVSWRPVGLPGLSTARSSVSFNQKHKKAKKAEQRKQAKATATAPGAAAPPTKTGK